MQQRSPEKFQWMFPVSEACRYEAIQKRTDPDHIRSNNEGIFPHGNASFFSRQEEVKTKFGALFTAFQYGAPPHAGMAPGIDRMIMLLADEESIRDIIAFPLNSKSEDLMMGAPSVVKRNLLRDVYIETLK